MSSKVVLLNSEASEQQLCLVCSEICKQPLLLPCSHVFCGDCLDRYIDTCNQSAKEPIEFYSCPVCRQNFSPPEKQNEVRENIDTIKEIMLKVPERKIKCDVCKYRRHEVTAKDYCTVCGIHYCEQCSKEHEHHLLFQTHSVVPVSQLDKLTIRCESHEGEYIRYYCTSCSMAVCTVCVVSSHGAHKILDLNVALGNKKEEVRRKVDGMSEKVQKQEEMLVQIEDIQTLHETVVKKAKHEIELHVNDMMKKLTIRKAALFEELDKYYESSVKQINIEKENCMFQLANMKSLWKFAAKLMEPTQELQLLEMHDELVKMVDGIVRAPDSKLPHELTTMMMFVPKESVYVGEFKRCPISSDLLTLVSSPSDGGSDFNDGMSFASLSSSRSFGSLSSSSLKWHNARLCWKADKVGNKRNEINEAYDVAINPQSDLIIVAEWLNQRIQIFDSTGYSKDIIAHQQVQPWGIAFTGEGNIAVTDEKDRTVKIFSLQGNCLLSWKKNIFGWPRGIAVNKVGHFIVTDTQHGKHCVSIHFSDGRSVRQFGTQGSGNEQFHWPRYVCVDQQDRIIVSDSSNHCLKVFDPTGQFVLKFGSVGSGDGQMKHPRGICVDPTGGILVADQDNNRVSLYNENGKFVRNILSIRKPWGIAISDNGLLAVTQKNALSLYKVFD